MPQLLLFAPCEKMLMDSEGNPSMIVILTDINLEIAENAVFPKDALGPKEWDIAALYRPFPEDEGKQFTQRIKIVSPDGSYTSITSDMKFTLGKNRHQAKLHLNAMPVGMSGVYEILLWLIPSEKSDEGEPIARYPIGVNHIYKGSPKIEAGKDAKTAQKK